MSTPRPPDGSVDHAKVVAARARELLSRNRVAHARAELASALREHPDDSDLLYELAHADYLSDNTVRARSTVAGLLRQDPQDAHARLLMCFIEQDCGNRRTAEQIIQGLLGEAGPAQPLYYAVYARQMLRAENYDKARELAHQALQLMPQLSLALQVLASCDVALGTPGAPSAALSELLTQDPDDPETLKTLVASLAKANRMREAHQLAQQVLRTHPTDSSAREMVRILRMETHWSLVPLWPTRRWDWLSGLLAFAFWLFAVILSFALARMTVPTLLWYSVAVLVIYFLYSRFWPPLLEMWLDRD